MACGSTPASAPLMVRRDDATAAGDWWLAAGAREPRDDQRRRRQFRASSAIWPEADQRVVPNRPRARRRRRLGRPVAAVPRWEHRVRQRLDLFRARRLLADPGRLRTRPARPGPPARARLARMVLSRRQAPRLRRRAGPVPRRSRHRRLLAARFEAAQQPRPLRATRRSVVRARLCSSPGSGWRRRRCRPSPEVQEEAAGATHHAARRPVRQPEAYRPARQPGTKRLCRLAARHFGAENPLRAPELFHQPPARPQHWARRPGDSALDQTLSQRVGHRLGSVPQIEPARDVMDDVLDRAFRIEQAASNFSGVLPVG